MWYTWSSPNPHPSLVIINTCNPKALWDQRSHYNLLPSATPMPGKTPWHNGGHLSIRWRACDHVIIISSKHSPQHFRAWMTLTFILRLIGLNYDTVRINDVHIKTGQTTMISNTHPHTYTDLARSETLREVNGDIQFCQGHCFLLPLRPASLSIVHLQSQLNSIVDALSSNETFPLPCPTYPFVTACWS